MTKLTSEAYAIVEGRHSDPFHYLGLHNEGDKTVVRAFLPEASKVEAVGEHGDVATLSRIHDAGLFTATLSGGLQRYHFRAHFGDNVVDLDDPYRFLPILSDYDLYLLREGSDQRLYDKLHAAKAKKHAAPLERALQSFRAYEEEASAYAAWLLLDTNNGDSLPGFTNFARADLEAIVIFHRDGHAPAWHHFLDDWNAQVARGDRKLRPFESRPIPPFTPLVVNVKEICTQL